MKTIQAKNSQIEAAYSHPSTILFRSIELKCLHKALKNVQLGEPSLDLGCGDGAIAKMLFDSKFTFGLDNNEAGDVEEAKKSGMYEKILIEDAEKTSLNDQTVGFVFSNCVLEHIPNLEKAISEVSRIMKNGGDFVFTVPSEFFSKYLYLYRVFSRTGIKFLAEKYASLRNKNLNHFHVYDYGEWESLLNKNGFQIKNHCYYMSPEAMSLWDKMALEVYARKMLLIPPEKAVYRKYRDQVTSLADNCRCLDKNGGAAIFHCLKK